jgi:xanthine/uracil permease
MYAFGMMALLGLAVLAVAKIGERYLRRIPGAFALLLVALGIGAAWLVDLNLFGAWSIPVRDSGIAVTVTGILLGGFAYFWREILGFFSGLYRKFTDEARTMERKENLRRAA